MPLDGICFSYVTRELSERLTGGKIEKIHQPETDEIILFIKNKGQSHRLLMTASAQAPRAHLTEISKENPLKAPLFCMVLRKHLLGGKILEISQPGFERVINIDIDAYNEMGDRARKRLIIEIMGKHSNVILVDESLVILDSAKRITYEISSLREVLPGKPYLPPPGQNKEELLSIIKNFERFRNILQNAGETKAQKGLYGSFMGISPVTASEICRRANVEPDEYAAALSVEETNSLFSVFTEIIDGAKSGSFDGELIFDEKNKPVDFSPFEMRLYDGYTKIKQNSPSAMLEAFYAGRDAIYRAGQKSQALRKLVSTNIERCVKKHDIQQKTLKEIEGRDKHRLYGELLTANIYMIKKGDTTLKTMNFYDPEGKEIEIPLITDLTPAENAQRYFKLYNKAKRTFEALQTQIKQNGEELAYLEGVLTAAENAESEADIAEIRQELMEQGYIKRRSAGKKEQKQRKSEILSFVSSDGFQIMVGKNNRQNDELTLRLAASGDIWLHTKDIPGSHVIIKTNGMPVPNKTLEEAANLAALYSRAKTGSLVPIDYTLKKHVKKPGGAKPGMVIYENQKTVYITPDINILETN